MGDGRVDANRPRDIRLLQAGAWVTGLDRFAAAPMLLTVAHGFRTSLAATAAVAGLYYLCYGAMQPVWGMTLDRLGRVRVIRIALGGAAAAGMLSAFAPTLTALILLRAITGGLVGAVVPAAIVYIGDTVPASVRQRPLASLSAMVAVGAGVASVGAGLAASFATWRLGFAIPALLAGGLAVALRSVPEPRRAQPVRHPLAQLADVARAPWALTVIALGMLEGGVILGFSTYLAPALETGGHRAATAGLVVSLYGVAVFVWSRFVRRLVGRMTPGQLIGVGGVALAVGYAVAAAWSTVVGVGIASIGIAAGWAFMHSSFQSWATQVAPDVRAAAVSCFSGAVFVGSALVTALAADTAARHSFTALFATAVGLSMILTMAGSVARHSWHPSDVAR